MSPSHAKIVINRKTKCLEDEMLSPLRLQTTNFWAGVGEFRVTLFGMGLLETTKILSPSPCQPSLPLFLDVPVRLLALEAGDQTEPTPRVTTRPAHRVVEGKKPGRSGRCKDLPPGTQHETRDELLATM